MVICFIRLGWSTDCQEDPRPGAGRNLAVLGSNNNWLNAYHMALGGKNALHTSIVQHDPVNLINNIVIE